MIARRAVLAALASLVLAGPAAAQYPAYPNDERSPRRRSWSRRRHRRRWRALSRRDRMLIERQEVPSSYGSPSPWN
ncbi:hypothetical protein [Phreatobacter sp. AB_2022a]|uniref:hypothetical protein n=1 Tax=Phreatobacter sp. AB_2022a TaxID=3003134 RepID=UPI002286E272|nr:hypothetical protein [Phreatobacter sp. AB_2022a]MCZ0737584.1 hypothetical protein [Phreatobacter sp. AB_2022a]